MSEFGTISSGAGSFDSFKNNKAVSGTKEFLESNSLVAKVAFLLLILVVFVIGIRMATSLLSWVFSYNKSPYLFKGMVDAKTMQIIPQDPADSNAVTIMRSDNEQNGVEFTYSVWMFIDDLVYQQGQYKHVFHKGNDNINYTNEPIGMNEPNNAPGLYIAPNTNALVVVMNTFNNINERVTIDNIPINKWVCVQIRVENHQLDTYINGKLAKRLIMKGVPKQNYGDVHVAMNGGFSGYMSDLRYFNSGLGTAQIQRIVDAGPNLEMTGNNLTESVPKYLSLRWFFMGNRDGYNP
jgi:hypothetical protein|tara:strand:+ start:1632 stop:2513 length:882 start_codon:yes stop_codon:yes gene_type:complete